MRTLETMSRAGSGNIQDVKNMMHTIELNSPHDGGGGDGDPFKTILYIARTEFRSGSLARSRFSRSGSLRICIEAVSAVYDEISGNRTSSSGFDFNKCFK